jgi:hypothetical protein
MSESSTYPPAYPFEAIFLFNRERISRELLYTEFEAILDGFIPLPDLAGTSVKAVYVKVGGRLAVTGAVFFLVDFDEKGMVDRRWNVPLQQLVEAAGTGPDMGAGAIRLACYSQCPIAWHQKNLWDPIMLAGSNSFIAIRDAVKANRLGFVVKPEPAADRSSRDAIAPHKHLSQEHLAREQAALEQRLHDYYTAELKKQVELLTQEQGLHVATLITQNQEKLHALQQEHQRRLVAYQQKLQQLAQENKELLERNQQLKNTLDTQAAKVEGMREYFSHKLKAAQQGESSQIQLLHENYALELDAKIRAATAELREMLDMREVELFYRHQNESTLKEEIVQLKYDNQQLLKNSGDQLLGRLVKAGVNLVAFLPGLGEVAIPLDDIGIYLENPNGYAANKVGVNEPVYLSWLAHHQQPCCNAVDARGKVCGRGIQIIETPLEFHPGESDRCAQHQTVVLERAAGDRG